MTTEENNELGKKLSELSARAAKLSERGAHYFVGAVIGIGLLRAEVLAEFEKTLHRIETDPLLSYCWRDFDVVRAEELPSVQPELSAAVSESGVPNEKTVVAIEEPSVTEFPVGVNTHARSGVVPIETSTATENRPTQTGFFAKFFRRQRAAA